MEDCHGKAFQEVEEVVDRIAVVVVMVPDDSTMLWSWLERPLGVVPHRAWTIPSWVCFSLGLFCQRFGEGSKFLVELIIVETSKRKETVVIHLRVAQLLIACYFKVGASNV